MAVQSVFARSEIKYLITPRQRELIMRELDGYMRPDEFGRSSIRSIYYDTDDYMLIRRSLSGPVYKEKLRLRSYGEAHDGTKVYAEIKKKFKSVVYKRRVGLELRDAERYLVGGDPPGLDTQIMHELDYFLKHYAGMNKPLSPKAFISSEREAFYAKDDHEFRITFDEEILGRTTELSLASENFGMQLLPEEKILMEVKAGGAIPLFVCKLFSSERIFKTPFSKYGMLYKNHICNLPQNNTKERENQWISSRDYSIQA